LRGLLGGLSKRQRQILCHPHARQVDRSATVRSKNFASRLAACITGRRFRCTKTRDERKNRQCEDGGCNSEGRPHHVLCFVYLVLDHEAAANRLLLSFLLSFLPISQGIHP